MSFHDYPVAEARSALDHKPPTISERLVDEKKRLEERLEQVDAAIDALGSNAELRDAVDALSKLGHF